MADPVRVCGKDNFMIRKLIAAASAAAVLLSLSSCGGADDQSASAADTEDGETEWRMPSATFESEIELPLVDPFAEEETE